jgi:hypothetical protein
MILFIMNYKHEIIKQQGMQFADTITTDVSGVLERFGGDITKFPELEGKVKITFEVLDNFGGVEVHYDFNNVKPI